MRELLGDIGYQSLRPFVDKVLKGERVHFETKVSYKYIGNRFISGDYIPHIEGRKVAGFYAVVADISNQKKIEEALQKALQESYEQNRALERINTDMDNFIYVASHDLRSPVVNLEGIITRLQKKLSMTSESEQILLKYAGEAISRLKQTISDLTEISRVQREIDTNVESVSFAEVFQEVSMDIAALITESGAVIHTDFQVQTLPYARKNLRSIIYNLLSNAIKYRSPDKNIEIFASTRETENNIVLIIQDNGLGIPEKQKHKLFAMFKRLHTHVEGSGIGLYILKRIVENYGGHVQVDSQEGEGSTFTVFFKKPTSVG
jgi:signal transduction histidine kinase